MLFLLTLLSAVLYSLGFAPFFLFPVGLFGLGLLFWLSTAHNGAKPKRKRTLLGMGILFSTVHGVWGLLASPDLFLHGASPTLWQSLPAYLFAFGGISGVFIGLFALAAHCLRHRIAFAALLFAALFAGRTILWQLPPFDCPWNPLSAMMAFHELPLQITAYIGGMGLDFLLAFCAVALFLRPRWLWWTVALGIMALVLAMGVHRLWYAPDVSVFQRQAMVSEELPGRIRLVQANLNAVADWRSGEEETNLETYISLSTQAAPTTAHTVIWPETPRFTSLLELPDPKPFRDNNFLPQQSLLLNYTRSYIPSQDASLTREAQLLAMYQNGSYILYNSLALLQPEAPTTYPYNKHILFPFGEGLPRVGGLKKLFKPLMVGGVGVTHGIGPSRLTLPSGETLLPLICYEATFPLYVAKQALLPETTTTPKAQALLNTANEVWFKHTHMPAQLLAMSRIRAVETGLPLVRVSNIHGTVVYDGFGRPLAQLPTYSQGVLDISLPESLPTTPWLRFFQAFL